MGDNKSQTINEEAGLPDNFVPIDVAPIIPSRPPQLNPDSSSSSSAPPVGSLPPSYQQNADFVRNAYRGQSTPNLSLMPLGIQGNPSSNAGIQSTAKTIVSAAIAAIPPATTATTDVDDGLIHGDAIWESDSAYTLIRDDFNAGGSVTGTIGENGWTLFTAAGGGPALEKAIGSMTGFPCSGMIRFVNTNAANAYSNIHISDANSTTNDLMPLFDYPGWKATFVFGFSLGDSYQTGPRFTQKSLYVGFAQPNGPDTNWKARPDIFIGLRYDTDTTAPSIADTTMKFEVVVNSISGAGVTRNNTQGTVVDTGVAPATGSMYRLDIQCVAAGAVTMSLNGSTPQSFNIPTIVAGSSSISGQAAISFNVARFQPTGVGDNPYSFAVGSKVTLASLTAPFDILNGVRSIIDNFITQGDIAFVFNHADIGGSGTAGTITGFPGVVPVFSFGNDTQAAPSGNRTSLLIDYFSLIWNPGVGGGTGTPVSTKPRYF